MRQHWKEVTKDEFIKAIGNKDVHPTPVGKFPYTSFYKTRLGFVMGKVADYYPEGSGLVKSRYYLPAEN